MTVDLKGMPVDYDLIKKKINKRIFLISDSAEAFGSKYKKKFVGSQFPIHSFSFFANKNMTMGEGGLITCENPELAKKIRIIRNQGQDRRYNHIMLGNNFRPTDYAAAIGMVQLKKIDKVLIEKNRIAQVYNRAFKNSKHLEIPYLPNFVSRHSWYMYCLKLKKPKLRNKLVEYLNKNNIDTRLSFPPIHLQPYYKKKFKYKKNDFPESEKTFESFVDIPCWMGMNNKQIKYVIKKIRSFFNKYE